MPVLLYNATKVLIKQLTIHDLSLRISKNSQPSSITTSPSSLDKHGFHWQIYSGYIEFINEYECQWESKVSEYCWQLLAKTPRVNMSRVDNIVFMNKTLMFIS